MERRFPVVGDRVERGEQLSGLVDEFEPHRMRRRRRRGVTTV